MWTKDTQKNALLLSKGTTKQLNNGIAFSWEKRWQILTFKKPDNNILCIK